MRIKLDENVPDRAVASLAALGHDIDTVAGEGLGGATERLVVSCHPAFRSILEQ